jgi:hypothetical protein
MWKNMVEPDRPNMTTAMFAKKNAISMFEN